MANTKKSEKKAEAKKAPEAKPSAGGAAKEGSKVKIDYVGSFDDGKVFDESKKHGQPIEFVVGAGQVIPGFDVAVVGMKVGDKKKIKIEAKDAYGEPNAELVKVIPRAQLPKDREPAVGMVLVLGLGNGMEVPARITKVAGEMITIDLNHPLAGKTLHFQLELVGLE